MDLIDKEQALKALEEISYALWEIDIPSPTVPEYIEHHEGVQSVMEVADRWARKIQALPSAQPEIVRCKDCEYGAQDEVGRWFCRSLGCQIGNEDGSGYCADAERRTNG